MKINRLLAMLATVALLFTLGSCEPDDLPTAFLPGQEGGAPVESGWGEMPLAIAAQLGSAPGTRASLLRDAELKGSGALVLVFRSATRQLESYRFFTQDELDNQQAVPLRLRVPLGDCDFYILGNLNGIRKTDGTAVNLMEALGAAFPVEENALEALVYRLDGGDLNGSFRCENFAEVASCGIPYALTSRNVNTVRQISQGLGIPGSDRCRRLFSKLTVRIDHAAFDGAGAHPEFFINSKLYLRQANARLQPFSDTPQKAQESADVLAQSDYDPDMSSTSASVTTFSFYVPENMQGTLLPGNTDSREKTRERLLAEHLSAVEPYLTYVEFAGRLDPAAGGYGGDVTYRFYVGLDNCSNFDLERNREYEISLTFRVGSLFDTDWKVETDNWTDRRLFCLTADPGFTDRLPDSKLLAVRRNRDGALYVYMNPAGVLGSTNALVGREAAGSPAFVPGSLADCAWYGELMVSGTAARNWLSARGITPAWDKAAGRLRLSVTDPGLFGSHVGEQETFSVSLLPGGGTARFTVKLLPDIGISVADGKSLTDEFYLGQKRTVTLSGFSGTTLCYAADQDPCGASTSGQAHTANRQWKTSSSASAAFPTARVDGTGHVVLNTAEYASQTLTGTSLDIWAWYPNRFQDAHRWTSKSGRIIFFSEDYLNDSVETEIRISEPQLRTCSVGETVYLPIDGTQLDCGGTFGYRTFDGTAALDASAFESALYSSLLAFSAPSYTDSWMECVALDMTGGKVYCARTSCSKGRLEELNYNASTGRTNLTVNHTFAVNANAATGLYSGRVYECKIDFSRLVLSSFSADGNHYNTGSGQSYTVRYFIPKNAADGVDQYTQDETFSLYVKYRFLNSDLGTMSIDRTGTASTYTASNGQSFGPVMEIAVDSFDSGSGGILQWLYDESHQAMTASNGEKIPGGLLLPYGEQEVTFKYRNRWDGREFSENSALSINYNTPFAFFVGATNAGRNARIFVVPAKSVKYLKRCASGASLANRTWMTQLFGHRTWSAYVKASKTYPYTSGINNAYHYDGAARSFPLTDFDWSYIPSYQGNGWSAAAVTALDGYVSNTGTELWTPNVYSRHLFGSGVEKPATPAQFGTGLNQTEMTFAGSDGYAADGSVNGWVQGMYLSTTEVFAN